MATNTPHSSLRKHILRAGWVLFIFLLFGQVFAQTTDNAPTTLSLTVHLPDTNIATTEARVWINGKAARLNSELGCYEGEVEMGKRATLRIEYPNLKPLEIRVIPPPADQLLSVRLGPPGSTYLQFNTRYISALEPDATRIGILPRGKREKGWQTSEALQELLAELDLEVLPDYPIPWRQRIGSVYEESPYISLGRLNGGSFEGRLEEICQQLEDAGYMPGVFLYKGQRNWHPFRGTLYLTQPHPPAQLWSRMAASNLTPLNPSPTQTIRFEAQFFPNSIHDWLQDLQALWDQLPLNAIEPEAYVPVVYFQAP